MQVRSNGPLICPAHALGRPAARRQRCARHSAPPLTTARPARPPSARPANAQELAERASSVIQCNEALREVTLFQNVGGKSLSRTFRYDKVRARCSGAAPLGTNSCGTRRRPLQRRSRRVPPPLATAAKAQVDAASAASVAAPAACNGAPRASAARSGQRCGRASERCVSPPTRHRARPTRPAPGVWAGLQPGEGVQPGDLPDCPGGGHLAAGHPPQLALAPRAGSQPAAARARSSGAAAAAG